MPKDEMKLNERSCLCSLSGFLELSVYVDAHSLAHCLPLVAKCRMLNSCQTSDALHIKGYFGAFLQPDH